ncbi:MAG: STAS domain-containing protein [Actinomycetota bacterium]
MSGGTDSVREDPVAGIDRNGDATIVHLAGELDLYNAHEVREALVTCTSETPQRLVVDLAEVKFVDSTALGVLIEARTRMENRKAFLLASPGLETRRALEISGLDKHFNVHESLDSALAAAI